jgi:transcriptional regulator with XRE-family HTH domain
LTTWCKLATLLLHGREPSIEKENLMADFGKLLRSLREAAGVSMGALARHLEVSVTYLSDVERGTRAPLSNDRIQKTAELLSLPRDTVRELAAAAGDVRGYFELDITSPTSRDVGATLMRGWPSFGDAEFRRLMEVLDELETKIK